MEIELIVLIILAALVSFWVGKKNGVLQFEKVNILNQEQHSLKQQEIYMVNQQLVELKENLNNLQITHKQELQDLQIIAKNDLEVLRQEKELQLQTLRLEKEQLSISVEKMISERNAIQKELTNNTQELNKLQEKFSKEFENLANKIFEEKTQKFTTQNQENLINLLHPLQEKIKTFEQKVDTTHKESIDYHAALREQIIGLRELNIKMSNEALSLTKALKGDSKTQGNWGELVLERVLEKSGLEKGREYDVEQSFDTEMVGKTRLRPDVIIHLPDQRKMIVDSKVSLTSYDKFVSSDDEEEKKLFLKEHLISLNRHIEQLSAKNYADLYQIASPDFVLLFMPIEPAFALALDQDAELYNKAFVKNIVIVTPSTLLATLRTIESMWKNEKQQRNALEIAVQASRLYEQFVNLTEDLSKVGKQLDTVNGTYKTAMKKLTGKGNLITKVNHLKGLGIKTNGKEFNQKLLESAVDGELMVDLS